MDTTTWLGQILGFRSIAAGSSAGSFSDSKLLMGRPFVFAMPSDNNQGATPAGNPSQSAVTVSGDTVSYTYANANIYIVYGIY